MFGLTWNNRTLRKYVIWFGKLFSDVYLIRYDNDGDENQRQLVPLNYGPRDKHLARAEGNEDLVRQIAIQLPRMSFKMTKIRYARDRKLPMIDRISTADPTDPNKNRFVLNPVPYDIDFTLDIMVKNAEDGTYIIEQILPFFTPEHSAKLNLIPDVDRSFDIKLILHDVNEYDEYQGSFENRRTIIWSLNFTLQGYLFGPTQSGNIINDVTVNFRVPEGSMTGANTTNTPVSEYVNITPGLTANGQPTTDPAQTINKDLIKSTDNYGFITQFGSNEY